MTGPFPAMELEAREPGRSALLDLALPDRWLAKADLRGAMVPVLWVLFGLVLSHAYLYGVLFPAPFATAPLPLYLPLAVILSALLLTPHRRWWALLAVFYAFQVAQVTGMRHLPLWYALLFNVANVIEPLIGALLIRRFVPRPGQFNTLPSVATYVPCVVMAAILGATWGSTVRMLAGASFGVSWPGWFLGDVLASLVVAPMIVLWAHAGRAGLRVHSRSRLIEVAALGGAFLLMAWLRFHTSGEEDAQRAFLRYLPVPLLVWAAVRFGPRGVLSGLSAVLVLSIAVASSILGPMGQTNVFTVQVFLLTVGVPLWGLAALVQERQETRAHLEQSEQRYHAIVSSLPHGAVLLFGQDLRHFFADGQGLPLLGLSRGDIEGKTPAACFPTAMAARLEPQYRAALAGSHHSFELNHEGRIYQAEVLPVTTVDQPAGMVLLQDVTHERLVAVLEAANEQLELANRAQRERVSEVSHELRAPLTSIQAFSELIRDRQLRAAEAQKFSGYINKEALRLSRLVSDLLDFSKVEAGRMVLHLERLDLNVLVEEVVATQRPSATRHALRLELDPELASVVGDRNRLAQVVLNLVSNAIKYSPEGGAVTVGTAHEGQGIHLWVRDEGIGIPPEDLERIFERYTRVATEEHPAIQGLGLGLPIVRHIVDLHGGRVWAESDPGSGSTFHVTLPLTGG